MRIRASIAFVTASLQRILTRRVSGCLGSHAVRDHLGPRNSQAVREGGGRFGEEDEIQEQPVKTTNPTNPTDSRDVRRNHGASTSEPLTQEDADRLANACESTQEKLIVWPLLDCGLRISELCGLKPKQIQWQQRCLRIQGKGGPHGKKSKSRVVPSLRVRAIFEPYFALHDAG